MYILLNPISGLTLKLITCVNADKKNFHYARSDTSSNVSDTSSICGSSSLSSPASSAPTTPTFAYSTPTLYFNPALYSQPPPSSHYYTPPTFRDKEKLVFGGCLGGSLVNHYHSLHRDRMLSTVPEVDYGSSPGNTGLALVGISEEAWREPSCWPAAAHFARMGC